ncbi:MAG: AMP-binding protein, partial [Acidimicrobiales bacterium]
MTTAAELFLRNADRDDTALHFEDQSFTYRQLATEIRRRAEMWDRRRDADRPPHIGVLLDNTPEYVFWLGAAALTRSVVVGINATYRGEELARLITHSDCQIVVTSDTYGDLLAAAPTDLGADDLLRTDHADYQAALGDGDADRAWEPADDEDLFLLIFTSGSTNFPKAVRCTQGRFSRTGAHVAGIAGLADGGAVYSPLPFFHSSSLFTGMSAAFDAQVPFGTRARFSASRTMDDIRRMDATLLTYTGKVLNYILAVPPAADDRDNPLRIAIGNEASESDLRSFSDRFACDVRDSYGSTEGMII